MPDWRCVYDGISDYEGETVVIYPAEMVYDRCAVQVTLHGQKWELEELGRTWSRMSNIYHVKYSAEEYERILSGWEKHNQGLREFLGRWNSNNLFESVHVPGRIWMRTEKIASMLWLCVSSLSGWQRQC